MGKNIGRLIIFLLSLIILGSFVTSYDFTYGLVSYYNMSEVTTDYIGSNDLTNNGASSVSDKGYLDGTYYFEDTEGDYMYDSSATFNFNNEFTVMFWIHLNETNRDQQHFIELTNAASQANYILRLRVLYDNFSIWTMIGGELKDFGYANQSIPEKSWLMLTATYNSTHYKMYYNNTDVYTSTVSGNDDYSTFNYIDVGKRSNDVTNSLMLTGMIDEISIWNISLSKQNISDMYDNFQAGFKPYEEPVTPNPITIDEINITPSPAYWDDNLTCNVNVTGYEAFYKKWYINQAETSIDNFNVENYKESINTVYVNSVNGSSTITNSSNIFDNDTTTFAYGGGNGNSGYTEAKFNITSNTTKVIWQIITNNGIYNITLPKSCIDNRKHENSSTPSVYLFTYWKHSSGYPQFNSLITYCNANKNNSYDDWQTLSEPSTGNPDLVYDWRIFYSEDDLLLNSSLTDANDNITCSVTGINGTYDATANVSIYILGSNVTNATITNTTEYIYNTSINCSYEGSHINYTNIMWFVEGHNVYNDTLYGDFNTSILPRQYLTTGLIYCNITSYPFMNDSFSFNHSNNITGLINVTFDNLSTHIEYNDTHVLGVNVTYDFSAGVILNRTFYLNGGSIQNDSDQVNDTGWVRGDNITFVIWYTNNQMNYSDSIFLNVSVPIQLVNQTFYVDVLNYTNNTGNVTVDAYLTSDFYVNVTDGDYNVTNSNTWFEWVVNGIRTIFGWGINRISLMFEAGDEGNNTVSVNATTVNPNTSEVIWSNVITWHVNVTIPTLEPDTLIPDDGTYYESINILCSHNYTGHIWMYDIDIKINETWYNTSESLNEEGRVRFDLTEYDADDNMSIRCRTWNEFFNYSQFIYNHNIQHKFRNGVKLYKKIQKPSAISDLDAYTTVCDMSRNSDYVILYHWIDTNGDSLYDKMKSYEESDSITYSKFGFNTMYASAGEKIIKTGCIIKKQNTKPWEFNFCKDDEDECSVQKDYSVVVTG